MPGLGLMITYADVTEERATERKLRENEERYSRVSEAAAEGIYDWNIADNTLYVSERVMEMFGFVGSLTSHDWYSRVHPDDAGAWRLARLSSTAKAFSAVMSPVDPERRWARPVWSRLATPCCRAQCQAPSAWRKR